MACDLAVICDLLYRYLKCGLPDDTIDMDLKVCTLKGIHTFKKDYKSQTFRCSPWRVEVQPYPNLQRKIGEFIKRRQAITTPYASTPSKVK